MSDFVVIAIFLVLGSAVRQLNWLPEKAPLYLNQFVIFVSLPGVILLRLPQLQLDHSVLLPMCLPWFLITAAALAVYLMSKAMHWSRETTGALMMVVPLGNTSYLGFPMVNAFFGSEALPYAIIYDQLGNFMGLAIYGTVVIAHYAGKPSERAPLAIIKRIFTFPPFLALLLAIFLRGWSYPPLLKSGLTLLAATMVPATMFIVGLQLSIHLPRRYLQPLGYGLAIKLLCMPLLAAVICGLVAPYNMAAKVSIFEAGVPPMVTAGVLAISANLAPRLAAATVGFGLLISLATLPLIFYLLP